MAQFTSIRFIFIYLLGLVFVFLSVYTLLNNERTTTKDQIFPSYMIIGFGKAGTRALYDVLRLHPQLNGPKKEERFFTKKYGKGLTKYLSSFPTKPANGFLIEKSPDYILDSKVPSRMIDSAKQVHRNANDMIFIVITHNPIDRAMSEYLQWTVIRKTAN